MCEFVRVSERVQANSGMFGPKSITYLDFGLDMLSAWPIRSGEIVYKVYILGRWYEEPESEPKYLGRGSCVS